MATGRITRRTFLATAVTTGVGSQARAQGQPVVLNIVDAAGDLALTQKVFENFARANPGMVSRFNFSKAPLPELPGKLRAQQQAGRVDIDLALVGYSGVATGAEQDIWLPLLQSEATRLPNLEDVYLPAAFRIQELAKGRGVLLAFTPAGPLLEYNPQAVSTPPRTAAELLEWSRANKDRFMYARPGNSGTGLAFLAGLPYVLDDANPTDPQTGWTKTWEFLRELGENIEYYPPGTAAMLKEFGEGSRDMMPTTSGFDINPRALGIVPENSRIAALKGFHWISDAHFACVPRGVPPAKLAAIVQLLGFMLTREQQALLFDAGYYYPGPAVKGVTLDMASAESKMVLERYGRPEYTQLIAGNPIEVPLAPEKLAQAFRRWDEQIGSLKR